MKFCWTTLNVKDMDESVRFYEEIVGLPLQSRHPAGPGTEMAFLGDGETKVELLCTKGAPAPEFGKDISMGFAVPSVDEKIQFLQKRGITLHSGPFAPAPNVRFFFVLDPDGLRIQFVEAH